MKDFEKVEDKYKKFYYLKTGNGWLFLIFLFIIISSSFFYGGVTPEGFLILNAGILFFSVFFKLEKKYLFFLILLIIPALFSGQFLFSLAFSMPFICSIFLFNLKNLKLKARNWVHTSRLISFMFFIYFLIIGMKFIEKPVNFLKIDYEKNGFIVNQNQQATFWNMIFFLNFGIFLSNLRALKGERHRYNILHYFLTSTSFLACLGPILIFVLNPSTGGAISWIVSSLFFSFLFFLRKRLSIKGFFAIFFMLFLVQFAFLTQEGRLKFSPFHKEDPHSFEARIELWKEVLPFILKNPITGYGFGLFPYAFSSYYTGRNVIWTHSENDYLTFIAEGGIFSLFFILFLFFLFFNSVKKFKKEKDLHPVILYIYAGLLTSSFSVLIHSFVDVPLHLPVLFFFFVFNLSFIYSGPMHLKKDDSKYLTNFLKIPLILVLVSFCFYFSGNLRYFLWWERVWVQEETELKDKLKEMDVLCGRYKKIFLNFYHRGLIEEALFYKKGENFYKERAEGDYFRSYNLYPEFAHNLFRLAIISDFKFKVEGRDIVPFLKEKFPGRPESYIFEIKTLLEKGDIDTAARAIEFFHKKFKSFRRDLFISYIKGYPVYPLSVLDEEEKKLLGF